MHMKRESDSTTRAYFRTERFNQRGGQWYFLTREGTEEGPYDERLEAEARLQRYIDVMTSGWVSRECELKVLPLA